jgi:hypothetical protein
VKVSTKAGVGSDVFKYRSARPMNMTGSTNATAATETNVRSHENHEGKEIPAGINPASQNGSVPAT